MKLSTPLFQTLLTPEVKELASIFQRYGYELRVAGGAVRDLLMNKQPLDIDFASTATPQQMKEMFTAENIRMISAKGESHGTISVRINDKENFEITSLRIDVKTDGRHADVVFTTDWQLDASRRDLTINSMFLGLDGTLYDYFNGTDDLNKHRVIFVGDPTLRIKEDYLRILRYFRFYGRIAVDPNCHDADTLNAIRENAEGLGGISGERIWMEWSKILTGNHCKEIVKTMIEIGLSPYIGLPKSPNVEEFTKVCSRSLSLKPHAMTLLTALLYNDDDLKNLRLRLKFSNYEYKLSNFIINQRLDEVYKEDLKPYQKIMLMTSDKVSDVQEWTCELFKYQGNKRLLNLLQNWKIPKFPVNGNMLLKEGFKRGPKLKIIMDRLKESWIESDFTMTTEELLNEISSVLEEKKSVENILEKSAGK
ncbi:CCA tRNA nucleotidyltransferase 1, mitochondrial isoform X2 [Centruroides vittatus]